MAIMDNLLTVSSNQAITTTAVSQNVIDLQSNRDIGGGERLAMLFTVTAAMVGGTSVQFDVVVADSADLATNQKSIASTGAIPVAGLALGAQFPVYLNPQYNTLGKRWLGANYTVVGTNTGGTVTAGIVRGTPTNVGKYYASGFTV